MKRNNLLQVNMEERPLSTVKVVEIEFKGGQKGAYHKHPCPVVGYIVEGTCLLQVEGEPAKVLKSGEAFFEPAETPILHFDNYSDSAPLQFIAYYLLHKEEELIELLPKVGK
ncbi:cupin domain-containing protein [Pontibacter ummariensis]|nr:cupin domain-containing protein [Pontibacter ummariensis]